MSSLTARLVDFFSRHVRADSRGIIAVSGGADSVALAHLVASLRDRKIFGDVTIAHLNHQLRAGESDADELFVDAIAREWDYSIDCERIDVFDRAQGRNLEETAREIRYVWLTDIAAGRHAQWIATAHTADDQAETVLHHFLRGTGLAGLTGIAECRLLEDDVKLIRPLLTTRRQELLNYLHANAIGFRVDSSNADVAFTRNRLRHEIMPLLEREVNQALVEVLVRTADQARECQAAINEIAESQLASVEKPKAGEVLVFSRPALAKLSPFWIREVFRLVWRREDWPMGLMNADDWRRLNELTDGSLPAHDFPQGVRARVLRHVVQLWRVPVAD